MATFLAMKIPSHLHQNQIIKNTIISMSQDTDLFVPHVRPEARLKEFTLRAIVMGALLGLLFAVGNSYLGLKVGLTVSASIPAAVISMALLRLFGRNVTILEHNMVQTIASSGEGMASGVIFTIPALFFLGSAPSPYHVFLLSILGGLLGVLLMIPLRRHLMVDEHATLRYPEGTACAQILKTREAGGYRALLVILGIGVGALDKALMGIFALWNEVAEWIFRQRIAITLDTTPSLVGVGFIIGPRYAMIMLAGGALGWWVLIPMIELFATGTTPIYPSTVAVMSMSPDLIWTDYIRYIGTGAVASGGIISLVRLLPLLYRSFHGHFKGLFGGVSGQEKRKRTDQDLPFPYLLCGVAIIVAGLLILPQLGLNWVAVLLIIPLALFFVGVTSITVGLIGNSSNPASGMIICTLLITCVVFLLLSWTEKFYMLMAMSVGCVVGISIALAGDTSQDLKTGMLMGATPRFQQLGAMIGVLLPAVIMGYVLLLLNAAYGFGSPQLPAPQATLMSVVVSGTLEHNLPISLVAMGAMIGVVVELLGIRALPFAIGLYLPMGTTLSIAIGGALSGLIHRLSKGGAAQERGILIGSGLIAGDALTGVLIAFLTVTGVISAAPTPLFGKGIALLSTVAIVLFFALFCLRQPKASPQ